MLFILNAKQQTLRVNRRDYPLQALARSERASVIMLLHMAVLAISAGRRFIDTELFGEGILAMLNEAR